MTIKIIESISGKIVCAEILSTTKLDLTVKNPLELRPTKDGRLGFVPSLYTEPEKMVSVIERNSIYQRYDPDPELVTLYHAYIQKLTSSIIQLDKNIQKPLIQG